MWAELLYWIGVLSGIWCVYDLFTVKRETQTARKLLLAVVLLFLSWVGIGIYFFFIRRKLK